MKEVHFGTNNSMTPTGRHESMGIREGDQVIVNGDLIGVINLNYCNYLVTRTTMAFDDKDLGKIHVRRAIADLYRDSSGILYIDQLHSDDCQKLEQILNGKASLLKEGEAVYSILDANHPDSSFECVTRGQVVPATAIKHEVFEEKRQHIASCHEPISELQKRIRDLEAQLVQGSEKSYNDYGQQHHRR